MATKNDVQDKLVKYAYFGSIAADKFVWGSFKTVISRSFDSV